MVLYTSFTDPVCGTFHHFVESQRQCSILKSSRQTNCNQNIEALERFLRWFIIKMLIKNVRSHSIELQPTWHERGNWYLPRGLLRRHICQNHWTTITPMTPDPKTLTVAINPNLNMLIIFIIFSQIYQFFIYISLNFEHRHSIICLRFWHSGQTWVLYWVMPQSCEA